MELFCYSESHQEAVVPRMNVTTRPATEADTDFARDVHHQAYRDVVTRQYGRWELAEQDQFFAKAWRPKTHAIVVADDQPCGYVSIDDRVDAIIVRELVILPSFQSRGIGTAILRETMERARGRGIPVHLGTHDQNRAQELYRRLGFREIDRTPTHILMEWRE
jgi:GNAT superfamily N-acetyltransferase